MSWTCVGGCARRPRRMSGSKADCGHHPRVEQNFRAATLCGGRRGLFRHVRPGARTRNSAGRFTGFGVGGGGCSRVAGRPRARVACRILDVLGESPKRPELQTSRPLPTLTPEERLNHAIRNATANENYSEVDRLHAECQKMGETAEETLNFVTS